MVAAEKAADAIGVTYDQMMEIAGRSVADAIRERMPVEGLRVLVLVGPGNNGGDGLVAGRYLAQAGADVAFYLYRARSAAEDANYAQIVEMGLFHAVAEHDQRYRVLGTRLNITDVVIDALLGTGVTRPIGGELAQLMRQVQAGLPKRAQTLAENGRSNLISIAHVGSPPDEAVPLPFVTAVDCPSGLNCDTGELDRLAIPAQLTVTFAGPKRGHFRFPGAAACGELVVADINIAPDLPAVAQVGLELVTAVMARGLLPERPSSGHKGTFGTAFIAAGAARYWGAPLLAGRGAYRAGAGLVALAVPGTIRATVAGQLPEATYPHISAEDVLDTDSARQVVRAAAGSQALLVGPGIDGARNFITTLLESKDELPPLVIDADGLNTLSSLAEWPQRLPSNSILTPHPGEMARLIGTPLVTVKEADRVELARRKAIEWGQIVLLKGAYSVVAAPDGRCVIQPFANPALAIGGTGDVLAGIIAGLLAQGMAPFEAAVLGAYLHGAAAELASEMHGRAGILSAEFADWVPEVRWHLERQPLTRRHA